MVIEKGKIEKLVDRMFEIGGAGVGGCGGRELEIDS